MLHSPPLNIVFCPDEKTELELYTDYLISTFGSATATGVSALVDGDVSHDRVTRFLSERAYTSKDLWLQVKSTVRLIEGNVKNNNLTILLRSVQCAFFRDKV